jgi:hypothetical protein
MITEDLLMCINIPDIPKKWSVGAKKPFSPGFNHFMRLHWTQQKKARDTAKRFLKPHFEDMPKMDFLQWGWYWGKSRFDMDNRQAFWHKMAADLLNGWKIVDDKTEYLNGCFYKEDQGQTEDLRIFIYGKVKK